MATFKVTRGTPVAFRDSAYPTAYPSAHEGELFYNSSSGAFQFLGLATGAWSSGGNMNTARSEIGGGGIQTSAMVAGGRNATLINNVCEIYNGTSWSEIAEINTTARGRLGAGADNEAFISIGGNPNVVNTETWNGSSWTEVGNLATKKAATYGNTGTVTAALAVGSGSPSTTNELWNGASWTEVGDLNTGGGDIGFFGTSTSAIIAGGNRPAQVAICESWNGTSWTEVADLNQSRENCAGGGSSNTAGIVFGGYKDGTGDLAFTESWDGTSWTEIADAIQGYAGGSSPSSGSSDGLFAGGGNGPTNSATYEWTLAHATKTIDVS